MSRGSRLRLGVALGNGGAVAIASAGRVRYRADVPFSINGDATQSIATAFQQLADRLSAQIGAPIAVAAVHVALLPPLVDARLISLPPLREREAELVIRRDASRHFVGDAGPRIVGLMTAGSRGEAEGGQPVFAAAAPVALAEAVRSAAAMMGWRVDAIVPAWTAWLAHAERDRSASRRPRVILAIDADAAHVLRVDDGLITGARRVPATMLEEIIAATGTGPGDAVIYADATHRGPVERSLSAVGWSIANAAAEAIGPLDSAAAGASGSRVQLVPPTLAAERRAGARGVALRIAAAAVLLLVGAAIVELWGSTRELEAVRARRAAIRAEVQPLLASRDSIERLERRAGTVRDLEAAAPRWTRALFDLALLLPRDTHITSMRTLGDTILIEATGSRAGDALQALRRAGSLEDVRMLGAIERELLDGETTSERFRLRARLNRPVEPDAVPPVTAETSAAEELGRKPMRRSM